MIETGGVLPLSLLNDIKEAGLKTITRNYRVPLKNACVAHGVEEEDCITIYLKKINPAGECDESIIVAGLKAVQKEYRVDLRNVCVNTNIKPGDTVLLYFTKTCFKAKQRKKSVRILKSG